MSFGNGIARVCQGVEDRHGRGWAWVTFIGIVGSALLAGGLLGWLSVAHMEWSVGREFPNQSPCNQPHVCDTFHGFLAYQAKDFWNNDIKKW